MAHLAPRLRRILVTISLSVTLLMTSAIGARPASATTPSTATSWYISNRVFDLINAERAAHYLPALHRNAYLNLSAYRHDVTMAKYNTMSHLLPGELSFGGRIINAGYNWRSCGENIAWNSDWTLAGAYYLERLMYNEVAPYNGHRLNILNRYYRDVGVYIYMDGVHHKMWLTVDFGLHM